MSVTALHVPYKKVFEPLVRIGENIAIPKGKGEYEYYRIVYEEPLQPIVVPVELTPYEKNVEYKLNELKLRDKQLGQWRLWIMDFISVRMKYPRATSKWTLQSEETSATPLSMAKEQILEFYTWEDNVPILYIDNPLSESQTARLMFWGIKYAAEKLEEEPETYTVVPLYSLDFVVPSG